MVKVPEGTGWLQTYKESVGVKEKIQEVGGMRKTRGGKVLIEINGQGTASEVTESLNAAIRQEVP